MSKYRFYRKDFYCIKDLITIIPTIQIRIDNVIYIHKNIAIGFNWLVFHARFTWIESEGKE